MSDPISLPIICVPSGEGSLDRLDDGQRRWAESNGFSGQLGRVLPLPGANGGLGGYLLGAGMPDTRSKLFAGLAAPVVQPGTYHFEGDMGDPTLAALGFRLGGYRFDRYRKPQTAATLDLPEGADAAEVERLAEAAFFARDLINTPTNDMGPEALERAIREMAGRVGFSVKAIIGDDLLEQNFPLIHAVGRAAAEAPRLLDLTWGEESDPKVTLVGKGVTFDTGGLDIKPAASMLLMKKDMGGAANILGLAQAIASAKLKVRLRVLIPIVENAISAPSFRPGDVLRSRAGITVEIGNTDAEGRLILADALALADGEQPEILLDMATLTGAARVALGPELPPLYSTSDAFADSLMAKGLETDDPLWRLPLWPAYEAMLSSKIADTNNTGAGGFAGSITAALFMKKFVKQAKIWTHLDIFAWAPEARAGRPFGATDQGIRSVYGVLKDRFGN
jgi:leucyl aminopeptidase